MADTDPQGTPAPVAQDPPAAPATPETKAPAETAQTKPENQDWIKDRLARAEKTARDTLLKELGIEDPEKAKAFIQAGRDAEEQQKSLAEKLAEHAAQLSTFKSQAERQAAVIAQQANAQLSRLSEAQQAAVKAIAGEDAAEQLRAIVALSPTWTAASTASAAAVAPPASTSPPASAPSGATPGSPPDHKTVHADLLSKNPIAAARYAAAHPSVFSE